MRIPYKTSQNLNGASTTFTYNAANETTQASGAINKTYSWDANGSQTGATGGSSFAYNSANQTTSVTPSGGSTEIMGYTGPGQAQRVAAGSTTYQYNLTGLSKVSPSPSALDIVTMPDGKPVEESVQGVGYYYLVDGQGNVVMMTDPQGNAADQYSYDPQGNYTSQSGSVPNFFGPDYLTVDPATGMWFLPGGELYDAATGVSTQMFVGFDPAQLKYFGVPNLYIAIVTAWYARLLRSFQSADIVACAGFAFARGLPVEGLIPGVLYGKSMVECNTATNFVEEQLFAVGYEGSDQHRVNVQIDRCDFGPTAAYREMWCPPGGNYANLDTWASALVAQGSFYITMHGYVDLRDGIFFLLHPHSHKLNF